MSQEKKTVGLSIKAVGEEASAPGSRVLQTPGIVFFEEHDDRRLDFVETGRRR